MNWSEVARQAIREKMAVLRKVEEIERKAKKVREDDGMELEGYRIRRLRQFHSPISGVPLSPPAAVWKGDR